MNIGRAPRCQFIFSDKNDELLRKSGPELAGWRNNPPDPPWGTGGTLLAGGRASVVPDPFHGTDISAP